MKDKYVLTITDEGGETTLEINDYLTGTKIKFTDKELNAGDGLNVGWLCNKLIEFTKDKYRSIADDTLEKID